MKLHLRILPVSLVLVNFLFIKGGEFKNVQTVDNDLNSYILKSNIPFITNKGQVNDCVKYYTQTFYGTVFVTKSGEIVYSFLNPKKKNFTGDQGNYFNQKVPGLALKEMFVNGKAAGVIGENKAVTKVNIFKGINTSKWKSEIPAFETVNLGEVYKGIEIKLKAYGNNVEKLFVVKSHAKPDDIKIKIDGAKSLKITKSCDLEVETEIGVVSFTKPVAFQDYGGTRKYIPVKYIVNGDEYSFSAGSYNPEEILVIDPILASTFIGGTSNDDIYEPSIAIDENGNVYISGFTYSNDFPTTSGVFNPDFNGGSRDRFVSKFNKDFSKLLASTFIGGKGKESGYISGKGDELGMGLALDGEGNVYIAGYTESSDFPTTSGSFDESHNGGRDIYVSKLDGNLSKIIASTYIGGTGDEGYKWPRIDITLSKNGDVYIAGLTHSVDFPTTASAFDRTFNGGPEGGDVFVVKIDKNLTKLLASTYIGGKEDEWRVSIVTDNKEDVYICGETGSSNYPVTSGAYDETFNVMNDIFISKFNNNLTELKASTVFGGSELEEALALRLSEKGNIYIVGYTESHDFPSTPGAYKREWSGGNRDAYIAIFDSSLSKLIASTLFGGSMRDVCSDLILDKNGEAYVTGTTFSPDFPATASAHKQKLSGAPDLFVSKFSANLDKLLISASFGGSSRDFARSIALDHKGNIYIAGFTSSENFPTTVGAYDNSYNGRENDCFIVKFDSKLSAK